MAHNEATFRDANERVEAAAKRLEMDQPVPFICECGRPDCMTIVRLTSADYERIRAEPTHFLYATGHDEGLANSRRIDTLDGAVIVEKLDGPGRVAIETDPRASSKPLRAPPGKDPLRPRARRRILRPCGGG